MAAYAKQLEVAEVAYAAIDEVSEADGLQYNWRIKLTNFVLFWVSSVQYRMYTIQCDRFSLFLLSVVVLQGDPRNWHRFVWLNFTKY